MGRTRRLSFIAPRLLLAGVVTVDDANRGRC